MEQVKIKPKRKKVKSKIDENLPQAITENENKITLDGEKNEEEIPTFENTDYILSNDLKNDTKICGEMSNISRTSESNINTKTHSTANIEIMQNIISSKNDETIEKVVVGISKSVITASKPIFESSTISKHELESSKSDKPTAPSYKELNALVNKLQNIELSQEKQNNHEVKPFTFEEIENLFGTNEIIRSRAFAIEFENYELQSPSHTHPLYEALTEYQRSRSRVIENEKKIKTIIAEHRENLDCVWSVKECTKKSGDKCGDGFYYSKSYDYIEATFQDSIFVDLQNCLSILRNKSGESHPLYSHSEHFLKIQIDELIWNSIDEGISSIKESLRILFWVLRTTGWGYDKLLRQQLRSWSCLLASILLEKDDSFLSSLFILHHVLRITHGIRWALCIISCKVNDINNIENAICMLEVILNNAKSNQKSDEKCQFKDTLLRTNESNSENELMIAHEADESLWTVVDSDGEGTELDALESTQILLKESDILGLIKQIPFKNIFKELMLVKNNGNEDIFCGVNLSGGSILKVFAATRLILKIIRNGLISYKNYLELTKELCRIALHCVMYCTDLWESACPQCESNLIERISLEYNNVFLAGWSTIEAASSKDISFMFLSEFPFKLCLIQHMSDLFKSLYDNLMVSDSVHCYYTLVIFSNMAISRTEEEFVVMVIKNLFEIGYISDFSDLGCGEWARTLCGAVLHIFPQYFGIILKMIPCKIPNKWFNDLPLTLWRPDSNEILGILIEWENDKTDLIPFLLKALDWKCQGGVQLHTQYDVAIFLSNLAEKLSLPKKPPPEWIWECVLILKLHLIEWEINISSAPHPDILSNLNISRKCQITNFVLMLMSSWGHSYPQIIQNSGPHLVKLAISGRFTEVIHVLYYIMPILSEFPESIKDCKIFKELLQTIIQAEKSYTKMATRLVTQDFPGPIIKMLADMIRFQLHYFSKFRMTSINYLVSVWINWFTSQDNWQCDWIIIYLLDVVLGCCFLHYNCMVDAANIFKNFIQLPTSSKSPSSSSLSSWFWNSSSSFKSLIQCNVEAPFLWHIILWVEHTSIERETGIWQKLIEKLTFHDERTKVNIDKTLKVIGGGDNSNGLVIYRSLQCAISTSVSHPIATLLWQLFFYLYLDISFLPSKENQKPVGSLFFHGLVNSRMMVKAKTKLLETKTYHENKANDLLKIDNSQNKKNHERITYHTQQSQLMNTFYTLLDENFFSNFNLGNIYAIPHFNKINSLMAGYNNTWTDTIDLYELSNYQNSSYLLTSMSDLDKYSIDDSSEPASLTKNNNLNLSPGEKILQRLSTYEDPVVESIEKFKSSNFLCNIDPGVFKDSHKAFTLIKNHLQEIQHLSRKYVSVYHKLGEIDSKLFRLLPNLYEKKRFLKVFNVACSTACIKNAQISLQGMESIFKIEVKENTEMNRSVHETIIAEIMQPYKNFAINTAIISKLAHLTCTGSILNSENGIIFFSTVMDAFSEDILKFPPAKQILNTIATHLGEKFISGNGKQCIALIEHHHNNFENMSLICSLLRPLELPVDEMLNLYKIVSSSIPNVHIAFSCLSKFRISNWLKNVRPPVTDRSKLINHICSALGHIEYDPPAEKLSLLELLCVHLTHVLSWEFPIHLSQVISLFCELTLEKKLPLSCWEHCITVIETYPHRVTHRQACHIMELFGHRWWSKRNNNGCSRLHDTYGKYIPCITRLGAILSSTILNSAMLHQPLLLTHQITAVVFSAMTAFWNVWLVPWWGGTQPIWHTDPLNTVILPWHANDTIGPETSLDAFVETISYCINTLPGSNPDFLRLTCQWYLNNFPHISVPTYINSKVHKALIKIPWSNNGNHWVSFADLQTLSQICNLNLPQCHSFILQCLKDKKWNPWVIKLPPQLQSNALYLLLPIFFKLHPEKDTLVDAISLPWNLLKYEHFEEILNWFMFSFSNPLKPFYSDETFILLCGIAGFKNQSEYNEIWQVRRICLIKSWVGNLSIYSQEIIDSKQKIKLNESISSNVTELLNKIEANTCSLVGTNETQQLTECTLLLNAAIMMLNIVSLQDITVNSWIVWIMSASKISIMALIRCILNVTQKSAFVNLAENTLFTYFKNRGNWTFIKDAWKNNSIVSVDYLISNNFFLTGYGTYISLDPSKYEGKMFDQIDKRVILTLHNLEPRCTSESKICLWIYYMISLLCNSTLTKENLKFIFDNVSTILEKWSQEPSWEIFKAIRLVQNVAPSYKFRAFTRYTYCAISDLYNNICGDSNAPYINNSAFNKVFASLEAMVEHKQCFEIKHTLLKCVDYSKDKKHTYENTLIRAIDVCSELYLDENYLIDTF